MQTRSLRTLLAVASSRSFAEAAVRQGMTLSAVSMQMKALEEQFGVPLFDRAFRPPRLTPRARQLLPHARAVVAAEDALLARVHPGDPLAGRFEIGFVNTASVRLLPGFLRRARAALPAMQFALRTGLSDELEEQVRDGRLDFAVVTGAASATAPDTTLQSRVIATERLLFACNAAEWTRDPAHIARTVPFLQFQPMAGIGRLIARHMAPYLSGGAPEPIVLDSVDAILECVKQGLGFTLLPEPDIRRSADASVAAFPPPGAGLSRDLCLIGRPVPEGQTARGPARAIHDLLVETAASGAV